MSILPQHHHLQDVFTMDHHDHGVYCSATTPPKTRPKLQKMVISSTPFTATSKHDDPSLKSTWAHRTWVATGCTTVLISLVNSIIGSVDSHILLEPILSGFIGYLFADLGTGVYHWAIDNYGDSSTPIFGSQIESFQGHHKWPWAITKRQFSNNLYTLGFVITFAMLPINLIGYQHPVLMAFVGMTSACVLFSQQIHAWAHESKSKLPAIVVALQDAGVLVSRSQHASHHRPPYNNNYCIVSGVWNRLLDEYRVFESLEMVVFNKLGLRPRSWTKPDTEWTEEAKASPTTSPKPEIYK